MTARSFTQGDSRRWLREAFLPLVSVVFHIAWFVAIVWVGIAETNYNFVIGFLLWLVFVYWPFDNIGVVYDWYYRITCRRRVLRFVLAYELPFLFMTVGLFALGPMSLWGDGYTSLSSTAGTRIVQTQVLNWHIPIYEKPQYWPVANKIYNGSFLAYSADGKGVTGELTVETSMINSSDTVVNLLYRYGSRGAFWTALDSAVMGEFRAGVKSLTIEQAGNNTLLLEDHIGTQLGLEELGSYWSGKIMVKELHRTAGK